MPSSGAKVMVAEDYDDNRFLIKLMLEMHGCQVVEAANGKEAVDFSTNEGIALILMDLDMPVMDGVTATREIKNNPATKDVHVVAVSAHSRGSAWTERAMAVGCDDCLSKPLDEAALERVLRRFGLCH